MNKIKKIEEVKIKKLEAMITNALNSLADECDGGLYVVFNSTFHDNSGKRRITFTYESCHEW